MMGHHRISSRAVAMLYSAALVMSGSATGASTGPSIVYPPFGLDQSARDDSTRPGDDFFQFANGTYLQRLVIPADKVMESRRNEMSDRTEAQLRSILEAAAAVAPAEATDPKGQIGAYYAAFMDEQRVERAGARPIARELRAIRDAIDKTALARLMGEGAGGFYPAPFSIGIDTDLKRPDRYAIYLSQSGIGLPDRDYYMNPTFAAQRGAYQVYAQDLLNLLGWADSKAAAAAVVAFETRLAEVRWTKVQLRDPTTQYNPTSELQIESLAPGFAWKEYLAGAGITADRMLIITQRSAFPKIAAVVDVTPIETLKAWMAFRVADAAAPYLSSPFLNARFNMRDRILAGQARQRPRWRLALEAVAAGDCFRCAGTLKWPTGQLYVQQYFPPQTKAAIAALAIDVKAAFRRRIEKLDWMSAPTKQEALKKLDTYVIKVGYPDLWRDYTDVVIRREDLVGNSRSIRAADWAYNVLKSSGPVDRGEWMLAPQMNNAYSGALNDIVFPAAILQAPLFDAAADPAINYGAIGAVVGHELTHGFDDAGRSKDSAGALRDWWSPGDAEAFKARVTVLGAQYGQYEPASGSRINPGLTMGENLADLGGLSIALDAYRASLRGKSAPVLGKLTGEQRVFFGWAQAWAGKATPEEIRRLTTTDPHSYRKYRVNGVVRNMDAWYRTFQIKPGDALYLPPEQRVRIW